MVQEKTGLVIDSYFSGTKINWNPEYPTITEEVSFNPTFSYEPTSYTWFFSGLASGKSSDTLNIKNPQLL